MSKPAPLEYGVMYHIFARGNNREDIFVGADNYRYFLDKYVEHVTPIADTFAYCLLKNHFGRQAVTTDRHYLNLIYYIHWNPQKHGFVTDFREYPYSSYHSLASDKPTRLERAQVIEWFNGREQFAEFHAARQDERVVLAVVGEDED